MDRKKEKEYEVQRMREKGQEGRKRRKGSRMDEVKGEMEPGMNGLRE